MGFHAITGDFMPNCGFWRLFSNFACQVKGSVLLSFAVDEPVDKPVGSAPARWAVRKYRSSKETRGTESFGDQRSALEAVQFGDHCVQILLLAVATELGTEQIGVGDDRRLAPSDGTPRDQPGGGDLA